MTTPPRWDLSNVYAGLEAPDFKADQEKVSTLLGELETFINDRLTKANAQTTPAELAKLLNEAVDRFNTLFTLSGTIQAYIHSFVATDSYNNLAKRILSQFEKVGVQMEILFMRFKGWIKVIAPVLPAALNFDGSAKAHAFALLETAEQSKYMMSEAEEALASELSLSGASAWSKLHSTVTSQLPVEFELDGEVKKLPITAIINLRTHPDESVRRRAYETEMKVWDTVREPLAAAMNGVKGTAITLYKRRGRRDCLHQSLDQSRIDRQTLDAMMEAMKDSFPMFRRYFHAKAKLLGKEKLAWWDLFAPVGSTDSHYTFEQGRDFILDNFGKFSPELRSFALKAFEKNWIDAEMRDGKVAGAFCMGVPGVKESRILSNFDGSLDAVGTIAHELGHGFHNYCAYKANKTEIQQNTPMTMAETASIMCETIVQEAVFKAAKTRQEKLAILEVALNNSSQVVVDITSRFIFEKEVFDRREKAELSADELCEIMENAQKATYGDGLDERYLCKYMWTWKPHYYYEGLSFYNYPYAFGLLFGIGLYAIYQQRGEAFIPDYMDLLASTGEASAADLAARFGIDIRSKKFWEDSLKVVAGQVEEYVKLVG